MGSSGHPTEQRIESVNLKIGQQSLLKLKHEEGKRVRNKLEKHEKPIQSGIGSLLVI